MPSSLGHVNADQIHVKSLRVADDLHIKDNTIENMINANANVQSDYNETDSTKESYIKNKPVLADASPVYASYAPTSTQTLTLNNYTKVILSSAIHETAGLTLDTTTGDITVTDAGTYLIHADFMVYQSGTGDAANMILGMWSGNTFKLRLSIHQGVYESTTLTGHALVDLTAGEVINFRIYASVTGGLAKLAQWHSSQGIYITKIA